MMQRKAVRNWLIAATLLLAIGGLLSIEPAMMSPMLFDAPGSQRNPAAIAIFVAVISFPVICAFAIVLSWIFYKRGRFGASLLVTAAPFFNLLILFFAFYGLG